MSLSEELFDVIVIGGGPVGENAADRASRTGLSVALVESELVGGECSYWACMPSKVLLRAGTVRALARDTPGLADPGAPDVAAVLARRDEITNSWDDAGQVSWVEGAGMTLVRGHGRLAGERLVEVTASKGGPDSGFGEAATSDDAPATRLLRARHAVIVATGSVPVLPDTPGLAAASPWSSREATSADAIPKSLVVVGGGVVGVEMANAYADLGAQVTLLARGGLLSGAEPFAGEMVVDSLRAIGVDVRTGVEVASVERPGTGSESEAAGPVTVTLTDGGKVTAAEILVATGRVPRTGDLSLESVGLDESALGRAGALVVDESLQVTGVPGGWLYACGDVTGRAATTHQGKYEGRIVGDVVAARYGTEDGDRAPTTGDPEPAVGQEGKPWSRYAATADHSARVQVVFTRPQVSWVGPTERAARSAGIPVEAVSYDLSWVSGASVDGPGYTGRAQVLVDTQRRVLVGATFVGPDAGEMLHAATIAIVGEVPLDRLWHAVPAYPTVSEVWLRFLESYGL
ncbi:dihydrolipoamide dehydrogenase [Promicromonospora sp. AC04]|uniref:dihydrolipoyl dehydrogenase family protein n=1 Tax=Promicromonospora sp. AC04 TaxID=2135723 RepID=UPI000D3A116F|nr:NAD(P)/FAD-dependent oxidoreductase [Promicromonospora sp. AC04]PUB32205.1 dihydrolipoamide dehydrogenase [Promicromonospora sp. AC04]